MIHSWFAMVFNHCFFGFGDDIFEEKNGVFVFMKDVIFGSPSVASSSVLGRSSNGWTEWKDKNGKTNN